MSIGAERKQLKTEILRRRREVLPRLRKAISRAKTERRKRLRACRSDCKAALRKARQRAALARRKLEIVIRRAKDRAKKTCASCKVIDERGISEISENIAALDKERREIDALRAQASMMISERHRKGGRKAAEKRAESDDQVIRDLGDDKEMIALFKRVRNKIKPSKHRNRTEAFFEYVHDHPEELDEMRSKQEALWEAEAERLFSERQPDANGNSCWDDAAKCRKELEALKRSERLLKEVPF